MYISVCNFCTKICGLINNYIHHGKNQPRQEVEDGYIFANIFVKKIWLFDQWFLWYSINQAHSKDWSYLQTNHIRILSESGKGITHENMHSVRPNQPILDQSYYASSSLASRVYFRGRISLWVYFYWIHYTNDIACHTASICLYVLFNYIYSLCMYI